MENNSGSNDRTMRALQNSREELKRKSQQGDRKKNWNFNSKDSPANGTGNGASGLAHASINR
ncbi:hypothetical protein ZHAS_00008369 [Anopheles sinensis]|uniref:Uncharacterized protein n=1 Tax=Anopheles sinensis TaxID=74873 RepID=A0A084VSA3_ANOSI|nr:hypothetical protein ZHAS_00008369 [Anopheles sinensis]